VANKDEYSLLTHSGNLAISADAVPNCRKKNHAMLPLSGSTVVTNNTSDRLIRLLSDDRRKKTTDSGVFRISEGGMA